MPARRKPIKKTVCAIANKICRIAWALLNSGELYANKKCTLGIKVSTSKQIQTRYMHDKINNMNKDNQYNL